MRTAHRGLTRAAHGNGGRHIGRATDPTFERFWHQERERLRGALTFTLDDADLAAEVVDEAMTRAYARWRSVARLNDPAGWVFHVAMNIARSALRKRRLRPTFDQTDPQVLERGPATKDIPPDLDLWAALRDLPIAQREVVVLRFHLDWALERIATAVDAPVGTVKSRLHRALDTLQQKELTR